MTGIAAPDDLAGGGVESSEQAEGSVTRIVVGAPLDLARAHRQKRLRSVQRLPERFGHWNSVWKRFDRLSKAGVFEAFFDTLASDELDGASYSDVRPHRRARACVGGRSKGGQEGQALGRSRGGFTTKIHAKSDASGDIIAFDLTGGEASDGRHFETLLDIGPDIRPRAVISRQRLRQQGQSPGSESARHRAGHSPQGQRKRQAGLLRANPLQGKGSHRAGRRTAQAVQARRATTRKDSQELQVYRRLRRRPLLDQIRPHSLALLWQIKSSERILTAGRFGDLAGPAAWRTGAGILIGGLRRSWRGSDTRRVDGCVRSTLPG